MKCCNYLVLFLALVCELLISCAKQSDVRFYKRQLTGTWEWVQSSGGIAYHVETPASTGKNIELKLTSDHKYFFYTNGALTSQGTFTIKTQNNNSDPSDKPVIDFSSYREQVIENIDNNSLELSDPCCDGFASSYIRK